MRLIYDIECYPNFTLVLGRDIDTNNYYAWANPTAVKYLKELPNVEIVNVKFFIDLMKQGNLIGYNNHQFDDLLLQGLVDDPATNFEVCSYIINDPIKAYSKYPTIDLFMTFNPIERISLKRMGVRLGMTNIEELPYKVGTYLNEYGTPNEIMVVIQYCFNDVDTTYALYKQREKDLMMRKSISDTFGVNVQSICDSAIGKRILYDKLAKASGIDQKFLKLVRESAEIKRGFKPSSLIHNAVKDYINNNSVIVKKVMNRIIDCNEPMLLKEADEFLAHEVLMDNTIFTFGSGGLHSRHTRPEFFRETDDLKLYSIDVASFYPFLMLNLGIYPNYLPKFLEVYQEIVNERIIAKKSGDNIKAYGLKIAVNGTFGSLNSEHSYIYHPISLYRVTVNGQLLLATLAEKLTEYCNVFSANTDGLELAVKTTNLPIIQKIVDDWCKVFSFEMEWSQNKLVVLRDVNNYYIQHSDNSIKTKGDYVYTLSLNKNFDAPIIAYAAHKYFSEGILPEETIVNGAAELQQLLNLEYKILVYAKTQKIDGKFQPILVRESEFHYLSNTIRFFVSKYVKANPSIGVVVKRGEDGDKKLLKEPVYIINKVMKLKYSDFVDYNFYINKTYELIRNGTTIQTSIFD